MAELSEYQKYKQRKGKYAQPSGRSETASTLEVDAFENSMRMKAARESDQPINAEGYGDAEIAHGSKYSFDDNSVKVTKASLPDSIDLGDGGDNDYPTLDDYQPGGKDYLNQVEKGRSVSKVNPNQPAFSEQAEVLRQNNVKSGVMPDSIDLGQGQMPQEGLETPVGSANQGTKSGTQANPLPDSLNLGNTTKPGFTDRLKGYMPQTVVPPQTRGPGSTEALDPIFQTLTAPLAAARDTVLGGTPRETADKLVGPPSTDWTENILGGTIEGVLDLLPGLPLMALGGKPTARPGAVPSAPIIPTVLSREGLESTVASRSLTKSAIETGAFPDPDLVPPRSVFSKGKPLAPLKPTAPASYLGRQEGYKDLPGYDLYNLTEDIPGHPKNSTVSQQTLEEAGFSVTPQGGAARQPRVLLPGQTAAQQKGYADFASKTLQSRILSPEMERTFASPMEERGSFPVKVQTSKSGLSAHAGPDIDESFVLPNDLTVANTLDGTIFPSKITRAGASTVDVMRVHGPLGNGIADYVDAAYTNRAIRSSGNMLDVAAALDAIVPRTTRGGRLKTLTGKLTDGENGFINGLRRTWQVTPEQEEQAFNYMITHGRMMPKDPAAKAIGDTLYQNALYPVSSDPVIRSLPGVKNPFNNSFMSFGEPNLFHPQQPIHPITATAIKEAHWKIAYEQAGGENLGVSLKVYKDTVIAWASHSPEAMAAKMAGLENMQLLDIGKLAQATGVSPYKLAKDLGYETDPFRASFKYNSMGHLRGQLAQIEEPVNKLLMQVPSGEKNAAEWLHKAVDRAFLNSSVDMTTELSNTIRGVGHALDIALLPKGGLANMGQASYIIARGGPLRSIQGAMDMITKNDRLLIEQSGATFPSALADYTQPTGPLATFSSAAYKLYGLNYVNRMTYVFAGHVGNRLIQSFERKLLADPKNQRIANSITELGGNPKTILQTGGIPDKMRLQMIQRFANHTGGVTDVRGVPLWATNDNPYYRLVNKYRSFALSNSAEVRRLIVNAPSAVDGAKRVATLLASAYVVGSGINALKDSLYNMIVTDSRPTKSSVRTNVEALVQGLGTMEGMLLLNAATDPKSAVLGGLGGPAATTGASLLQDLIATGTRGFGWRSVRTLSRMGPIGPFIGPVVQSEAKRESKNQADNTRLQNQY